METIKTKNKMIISILLLAALMTALPFAFAGDLEPPAPPASTMKTLDEVEPRVPIHAADLPLTITEPNSYYLVEDVTSTDPTSHAITIECNDVTIDLMGYTLKGPDSGTKYGIYMNDCTNVEIRNGTVRDFYHGIYGYGTSSRDYRVIDTRSCSNSRYGIYLGGRGHLVKDCTVSDNGTSANFTVYGIYVSTSSTITGNTVCSNGGLATDNVYAIKAGSGSTVTGNTAHNNGESATGSAIAAIAAGFGSTVTGNTAHNNGDSANSTVYGIHTSSGCTVTGNTAYNNGDSATGNVHVIYASSGSTVTGNTIHDNGESATITVYGIYVSTGGTIVGNSVRNNGDSATGSYVRGIYAGTGSTVIGNTAHSNGNGASGTVYGIYLSGNNLVDQNTAYDNGGTNMDTTKVDCTYGINHAP